MPLIYRMQPIGLSGLRNRSDTQIARIQEENYQWMVRNFRRPRTPVFTVSANNARSRYSSRGAPILRRTDNTQRRNRSPDRWVPHESPKVGNYPRPERYQEWTRRRPTWISYREWIDSSPRGSPSGSRWVPKEETENTSWDDSQSTYAGTGATWSSASSSAWRS